MITVTLPNGKRYNFSERNLARARALALKTNGTVASSAYVAPPCACGRARCGGCDDVFDARRDASRERGWW